MQSLMLASKADFTELALRELNEANEAGARTKYATGRKRLSKTWKAPAAHDDSSKRSKSKLGQHGSQHD